jgi:hypothetical protein
MVGRDREGRSKEKKGRGRGVRRKEILGQVGMAEGMIYTNDRE